MDENYYRSLIDKVRKNEERMWSRNESPDKDMLRELHDNIIL